MKILMGSCAFPRVFSAKRKIGESAARSTQAGTLPYSAMIGPNINQHAMKMNAPLGY